MKIPVYNVPAWDGALINAENKLDEAAEILYRPWIPTMVEMGEKQLNELRIPKNGWNMCCITSSPENSKARGFHICITYYKGEWVVTEIKIQNEKNSTKEKDRRVVLWLTPEAKGWITSRWILY